MSGWIERAIEKQKRDTWGEASRLAEQVGYVLVKKSDLDEAQSRSVIWPDSFDGMLKAYASIRGCTSEGCVNCINDVTKMLAAGDVFGGTPSHAALEREVVQRAIIGRSEGFRTDGEARAFTDGAREALRLLHVQMPSMEHDMAARYDREMRDLAWLFGSRQSHAKVEDAAHDTAEPQFSFRLAIVNDDGSEADSIDTDDRHAGDAFRKFAEMVNGYIAEGYDGIAQRMERDPASYGLS